MWMRKEKSMEERVKEILEGLKTAMEAELTGHTFYKNAAENTSNPMGKKTLTFFR